MPQNQNHQSSYRWRKFFNAKSILLYLLAAIAVFAVAFPKLYEIKAKAGIDIAPGKHAGTVFEKYTKGLFKCEWLYPYHCDDSGKG